jgi:CheY-like chemotaxis protein
MLSERDREVSVLLVDDDDVDVMAVKRAFQAARISNPITVARDGVEGLARLRGDDGMPKLKRPYVIVLDLNMPRMDGIEFLTELRADEEHHDAVVFVLTTSKDDTDRSRSYDKNVAGYILKSEVGEGFLRLTELLDNFWRVVLLPA